MRWRERKQNNGVDSHRRIGRMSIIAAGGIAIIILALFIWLMRGNQKHLTDRSGKALQAEDAGAQYNDTLALFVSTLLKSTDDIWTDLFEQGEIAYRKPSLVLFSRVRESACGYSSPATGPFYCPGDEKIYIDMELMEQLQKQTGVPGNFAMAYIIAHEAGHHIQNLLGITTQVEMRRGKISEEEFNDFYLRMELQADFLAGIWAHNAQIHMSILNEKDIQAALKAASLAGSNRLQMESQGYIIPDALTHGSLEQRVRWFLKGFLNGDLTESDTFQSPEI